MSPVLTRWRTRCQAAIHTGDGLPDLGFWLVRNPDRRLVRGLRRALDVTAGADDPDKARILVNEAFVQNYCASTGMFRGLQLALTWLDQERAAEAALTAEASK